MLICPKCGNNIPENSTYCPSCGENIVSETPGYKIEIYGYVALREYREGTKGYR